MALVTNLGSRAIARGAVLLVGAVVGYGALSAAMVNASHRANPALALRFDADDAVALTELSAQLIGNAQTLPPAVQRQVADLSRRSIVEQAINGPAVQMLGLVATQTGDAKGAHNLFTAADKLSRRDLGTQFFMIEDAVTRNDLVGAFRHYDAALRTSPGANPILFPVMTTALEDRRLWPAFLPYLKARPPWLGAFLTHAVRETKRPEAYALLLTRGGGLPDQPEFVGRQGELLRRLVDEGRIGWAASYYATLPSASPTAAGTMAFTPATIQARYMPIEWELSAADGVTMNFSSGDGGIELEGMIDPDVDGVIARKLTFVSPGRYSFVADEVTGEGANEARLRWRFECVRPAGRKIVWDQDLPKAGGERRTSTRIDVPRGCPALLTSLIVHVPHASLPVDVRVRSVTFRKTG